MADQTVVTGTAVQEIAKLVGNAVPIRTLDVGGVPMTPENLHDARPKLPAPSALVIHTLTGLIDYVAANRDGLALAEHLAHVVDPERVEVVSRLQGTFLQRFGFVTAEVPDRTGFQFGRYIDLEQMNISLQSLFTDAGDRAMVLQLLGTVVADAGITRGDDGASQNVTAKAGITVLDRKKVPNPVELAPFRTFPEIVQPESPFILRLRMSGESVEAALFEADGGAWKSEAIKRVAMYLRAKLPEELAVIA